MFGIERTVYPEIAKLFPLGMRFNKETREAIDHLILSLNLPEQYVSIQIRGGDKNQEYEKLYDAEECLEKMKEHHLKIKDLFVFTDDYRNVEYMKKRLLSTNIYTLTGMEEKGYVNEKFQKASWDYKKNLIKLFAMTEICCNSELHLGCEQSCVNNIIKVTKREGRYIPLTGSERC